ncbi:hypothetical protein A2W14_05850 [Candidatus Gottesmanbacteria bacterium RBG_16_37_8]|uniref:Major facilitator superfamily (MFS) profile domain-containing protein n=1 Tax=Candidatus Gottesmanbacteria bacterium RBG_16_37_8 TaxID=1798371 RepID=A0A1F5YUR9_9BACT|nr:MAG: hypothetical protein A2W14_05850 [Candidatus Gottesmanbacteria bacterium RBG_16_37_8]
MKLLKLSHKNNLIEVIFFYIFHVIFMIIVNFPLSKLLNFLFYHPTVPNYLYTISGMITQSFYPIILSLLILKNKNLIQNRLFLVLSISTLLLGYFLGGMVSLIIPSFLSSRDKQEKS